MSSTRLPSAPPLYDVTPTRRVLATALRSPLIVSNTLLNFTFSPKEFEEGVTTDAQVGIKKGWGREGEGEGEGKGRGMEGEGEGKGRGRGGGREGEGEGEGGNLRVKEKTITFCWLSLLVHLLSLAGDKDD